VISLLELLKEDVKEEEITEGMEQEHDHEEESEADEHVWLSLRLAQKAVSAISEVIAEKAPAIAADCRNNAAAYRAVLAALDEKYASMVSSAPVNTVLFGDRFPFRYLCEDYGLKYYAAFTGCSAETEASFETVIFLAEKTDELKLPAILTIEGGDQRLAETIRENTKEKNQAILTMDSMQKTGAKVAENSSYLSIMEHNYEVLKEALNGAQAWH
jgi:zinc transport system substrate-binding protein